jgi:hypothetical protein
VVVAYLDVIRISIHESKANPPLIVDRNRVLISPVAFQSVQSITRWYPEVLQTRCQIYVFKLTRRTERHIRRESSGRTFLIKFLRAPIGECPDHSGNVACHVMRGKHVRRSIASSADNL